MSTRKGGGTHSRKPAHQNSFAFRHNPKSKKTERILGMTNQGLCKRCHDKIEWRKKYRKYKPLTTPKTCNNCHQKTIVAAYHELCQPCAKEKKVCAWCCERGDLVKKGAARTWESIQKEIEDEAKGSGLNLRETKALLRQAEKKFNEQGGDGGGAAATEGDAAAAASDGEMDLEDEDFEDDEMSAREEEKAPP